MHGTADSMLLWVVKATYVNVCTSHVCVQDLLRRPRGLPRAVFNPFTNPGRALGYSEWGFTKANEVFAGRWVLALA